MFSNSNLQQCKNYRTISLICHPSKVLLKVLLNSLKHQAESIIAEEQAGFWSDRSTTEQIFNLRILCERYLQHQQDLYHVFIDCKKAFDRVWQKALWSTMRLYNISANLICTVPQMIPKMNRKWSSTASDPLSRPQMIPCKLEEWNGFCRTDYKKGLIIKKKPFSLAF